MYFTDCYEDEIATTEGVWCKDKYDSEKDICNGYKPDCVLKGKRECWADPNCKGIMFDDAWSLDWKGVKMCSSTMLEEKKEKDWSVFLRCDAGMATLQ